VAEEVFESDVPVPNVAQMQTRAARPDRPEVDLRRLVAGFLRMTPDVAIVGDVRDREGLPELLSHVVCGVGRACRLRESGRVYPHRRLVPALVRVDGRGGFGGRFGNAMPS
jgi:hypothetical protein